MAAIGDVLFSKDEDNDADVWDDTALVKAYDKAVNQMKDQMGLSQDKPNKNKNNKKKNKKKANKKKANQNPATDTSMEQLQWHVGDQCRAVFGEDGLVYEAKIIRKHEDGMYCTVRYLGYGNEEEQDMSELLPIGEDPSFARGTSEADSMDLGSVSSLSTSRLSTSRPGSRTSTSTRGGRGRGMHAGGHPGFSWPPPFPGMNPAGAGCSMGPPGGFPMMPPMFPTMPTAGMQSNMPSWPQPPMLGAMPPPPVVDEEIVNSDKDALHSMLISWYMSGYHTGYYQGLRAGKAGSSNNRHHQKSRSSRHHHTSTTADER